MSCSVWSLPALARPRFLLDHYARHPHLATASVSFVTSRGFALEREFLLSERPYVPNAPEQCHYRGFLFRRV